MQSMRYEIMSGVDIEKIAKALGDAKRSGDGWGCKCPAHNDNTASLSISKGTKRDIIFHCHCELDTPSAIKVAEAVEHIKPLFYEDPLAPSFFESWLALRRTTRIPLMTGENIELPEGAMPFLHRIRPWTISSPTCLIPAALREQK